MSVIKSQMHNKPKPEPLKPGNRPPDGIYDLSLKGIRMEIKDGMGYYQLVLRGMIKGQPFEMGLPYPVRFDFEPDRKRIIKPEIVPPKDVGGVH